MCEASSNQRMNTSENFLYQRNANLPQVRTSNCANMCQFGDCGTSWGATAGVELLASAARSSACFASPSATLFLTGEYCLLRLKIYVICFADIHVHVLLSPVMSLSTSVLWLDIRLAIGMTLTCTNVRPTTLCFTTKRSRTVVGERSSGRTS